MNNRLSCILLTIVFGSLTLSFAHAELLPEAGPAGTTVTISGKEFGAFQSTQVNRIEFNGISALIQLWEPDFIMVKVPLQATTGPVMVINGNDRINVGTFTRKNAHIKRVEPTEAEAGSVVTIHGTAMERSSPA